MRSSSRFDLESLVPETKDEDFSSVFVKRSKFKKKLPPRASFFSTSNIDDVKKSPTKVPSFFSTASSSDEFIVAASPPAAVKPKPPGKPPAESKKKKESVLRKEQLPPATKTVLDHQDTFLRSETQVRHTRHQIEELKLQLEAIKSSSVPLEDARQLIYQALFKGAGVQRLAYILETLHSNKVHCRYAFDSLAAVLPRRLTAGVHVEKALADSINRRGWEAHLQRMRQEQLMLLAENRVLLQKVEEIRNETRLPSTFSPSFMSRSQFFSLIFTRIYATSVQRHLLRAVGTLKLYGVYNHEKSLNNLGRFLVTLRRYARIWELLHTQAAFYRLAMLVLRDAKVLDQRKGRTPATSFARRTDGLYYGFEAPAPIRYQHTYMLQRIPPSSDALRLTENRLNNQQHDVDLSLRYRPVVPTDYRVQQPVLRRHYPRVYNKGITKKRPGEGHHDASRDALAALVSVLQQEPEGLLERRAYNAGPTVDVNQPSVTESAYERLMNELLARLSKHRTERTTSL